MALPGVRTTILDRFYEMGRTDLPSGPTLALIAKRNLYPNPVTIGGPVPPDLTPYLATGEFDVITMFGENSNLHRAYREASSAGAPRIVLIPLPANAVFVQSSGTITSAATANGPAYTGEALFDAAFDAVESVQADVVVPWGAGSASTTWDDQATPATPGGAADDFFYADNTATTNSSWVKKVADKCATITTNSYPVFGVLGVKGFAGLEYATTPQVSAGLALPNLTSKENVANGHFVTIVANELTPLAYAASWGWANGATTFGASAVRKDPWLALTGKPVFNVDDIRYDATRVQAESLSTKGVVTAAQNFSGALQWVDATTFAPSDSDFSRLTTLRIAFDVVKLIVRVGERYKGESMSLTKQNAFDTEIGSKLRGMQQVGAINNSDYRVRYAPSESRAYVDIAIAPAFELREIILTVSINFG